MVCVASQLTPILLIIILDKLVNNTIFPSRVQKATRTLCLEPVPPIRLI